LSTRCRRCRLCNDAIGLSNVGFRLINLGLVSRKISALELNVCFRQGLVCQREELGVPFLGEVPLNLYLRETGDEGKMEQALLPGSPARPHLLAVVEQLAAQISIQNIKTPKMPKLEILS